jgi:hypothetical protein
MYFKKRKWDSAGQMEAKQNQMWGEKRQGKG